MTATAKKTADKFRAMAAKVGKEVADKKQPRRDATPKQSREAMSRRIEADHLERVRTALLRLADAHETGTLPPALAGIKSKAELLAMLRTHTDHSRGYYVVVDTREFADKSEAAVALRAFLDAGADPEAAGAKKKADRLFDLEQKVKFADIPGFFPTPPAVIARMMEWACVRPGMSFLEPSAGKGDIVDAILVACPEFCRVTTFEINPALREIIKEKGGLSCGDDFLAAPVPATEVERYDRVLMNPPFERGADIDHVQHACRFLKSGGRLVSVMSAGPFFRSDTKATEFRGWFERACGEKIDLPDDAFKDAFRSTGTKTVLVVIDRP